MKINFYKTYLSLLVLFVVSCSRVQKTSITKQNKTKHQTSFSDYLTIKEEANGVLVQIIHPDRRNKKFNYFIPKNSFATVPKDYIKIDKKNMSFLVFSTTHIGMLDKLNQIDKIKGTCSKALIFNRKVVSKIENGTILDFGNETVSSLEKIILLKPKTLIYSGYSSEFQKETELQKMGITAIPNFDWKESHPLGKAEWILLFGYLTGTEKTAKAHLEKVKQAYTELQNKASRTLVSPGVLMGSKIGDFWYGPAGESYGAQLLKDAHSNYIHKNSKGSGSNEYSLEKVFADAENCDFWINPGYPSYSLLNMNNPKGEFFKAFRSKKVYCYTNNPNKYWELSGVQPDWILSDFIQILHPELDFHKPLYFYKALE